MRIVPPGLQPPARFVWCESPIALSHVALPALRAPTGRTSNPRLIDRLRRQVGGAGRKAHARGACRRGREHGRPRRRAGGGRRRGGDAGARRRKRLPLLDRLRRATSAVAGPTFCARCSAGRAFATTPIGPHELSWLGTYEYLRNVLGLRAETEPLLGLWQLAKNAGLAAAACADLLAGGAARAAARRCAATGCTMRAGRRCGFRTAGRSGPGKASRFPAGSSSSPSGSRSRRSMPSRTFRCAAA